MNKLVNVRQVVNASGRMTKLGVSTPNKSVLDAMIEGAGHYVVMDELLQAVNTEIAKLTGAKASCVVASASSGIALVIASLIAKDNIACIEHLQKCASENPNEILMLKGHNVNYGVPIETMVNLGGGQIKEVGSANLVSAEQLEAAITDQTVALFYVKSHHAVQKNMLSWQEMVEIAHAHNLPLIIDAAAEEDLSIYNQGGADYVIYSGTKALEGPTAGFVLTQTEAQADFIKAQYHGIGRAMKVGKETLYGILQAVKNYVEAKPAMLVSEDELRAFMDQVQEIPGVSATWEPDEAGRPIKRIALHIAEQDYGQNARQLARALELGDPAIFLRDYKANAGVLSIDPRPLLAGDLPAIYQKLQDEMRK